ncbi:MAG TPA: purine-nucleoside phosphorylase [Chitinophagaceae bacterium]|nr:purine-nucleoside phosphorylase [Chitinophagaceae bacterium]
MTTYAQQITETAGWLKHRGILLPKVGVVLGTGLGELVKMTTIEKMVDYSSIPNFPVSTVEFHKGNLIYGKIGNTQVLAMQGRFHYYEGYGMQQITFPVRVMKELGVQYLLLSNAAGGINLNFKKGDLVLIDDHINLQPESPLRGLNDASFGDRFPDMSSPYNGALSAKLKQHAEAMGLVLKKGTYTAVMGPNLETKAEYRYLKIIGADLVGMSTVPEVIVANQCGIPCAAISVVTDECDPDNLHLVSLREIIEVAAKADIKLSRLFAAVIETLA